MCVYVFVRIPGCLQAVRATAWPPPWRWVVPLTIAALPATCLVPVTPPEALLTGGRSPCLSSKEEGGGEGLCLSVAGFVSKYFNYANYDRSYQKGVSEVSHQYFHVIIDNETCLLIVF